MNTSQGHTVGSGRAGIQTQGSSPLRGTASRSPPPGIHPHPEQAGPLTWAPASQGHNVDSARCLAGRPPQAGSGGTAACSSRQRCQEGRARGTESHSSPARRTRSYLCLQNMAHSACSGHSWEEKEYTCNTRRASRCQLGHSGRFEPQMPRVVYNKEAGQTISVGSSRIPAFS